MSEREFDVVVIGAGPAGEVLAGRLAEKGGKRVAIVESHLIGGECSFYGCMPSKALLRPREILNEVARVPGAAQAVTGELDVAAVFERRDGIVNHLDDSNQVPWLEKRGVTLVRGQGRLDGERRVRVGDEVLHAREAVAIATGSDPLIPPIPGLAEANAWSNRELTTTSEVPRQLLVLGGGVIGVELAQAWRSFGSEVTIVEALDRLLPPEEPFAGEQLAAAMSEAGIAVRLGRRATSVQRDGERIAIELEGGDRLAGDRLLVAIGRQPRSADLGLEAFGLEPGKPIEVDDRLRVPAHPWLYAVGDVNGRALLTHMGKYQARIAADQILGEDAALRDDGAHGDQSPRVVFTDPQVGAVGHTLASAEAAGIRADAVDLPTASTAGASFYGRGAPGTTRFVVDRERELLVGATFVGPEIADFVQAATIAIVGRVPLRDLVHAVAPFPTRSELWLKFIEAYGL